MCAIRKNQVCGTNLHSFWLLHSSANHLLTLPIIIQCDSSNEVRTQAITKAYEKIDAGTGAVTLDDIARLFDASQNPQVVDGSKAEQDVYMEFMSLWDTTERDGVVTFDEFLDYHRDISSSCADDQNFVHYMDSSWRPRE